MTVSICLAPGYWLYSYGPAAKPEDEVRFVRRYERVPPGYLELVEQATGIVLLWKLRGELRLWGPDEAIGMDEAYGVSVNLPGAVAIGDNGGGELIVHGDGPGGTGLYLVDTGSLFLDDDAPWLAPDLKALLEQGQGADLLCRSEPIDPATLGAPIFCEKDYG